MQENPKLQNNVETVFSEKDTLASVDGDLELLREVVGMFMEESRGSVAAVRKAIDERNAVGLDRSAHALKGMVGNFGALTAVEMALELEMMGKNADLAGAEEVFASLRVELERLKRALEQFAGEAA